MAFSCWQAGWNAAAQKRAKSRTNEVGKKGEESVVFLR